MQSRKLDICSILCGLFIFTLSNTAQSSAILPGIGNNI